MSKDWGRDEQTLDSPKASISLSGLARIQQARADAEAERLAHGDLAMERKTLELEVAELFGRCPNKARSGYRHS